MSEKIYGVMVTGKDAKHEHLARQSVKSFIEQTYSNKKLLIINDGEYSLKDSSPINPQSKYVTSLILAFAIRGKLTSTLFENESMLVLNLSFVGSPQ